MARTMEKINVYGLKDDVGEFIRLRNAANDQGIQSWKFFQNMVQAYKDVHGGAA